MVRSVPFLREVNQYYFVTLSPCLCHAEDEAPKHRVVQPSPIHRQVEPSCRSG